MADANSEEKWVAGQGLALQAAWLRFAATSPASPSGVCGEPATSIKSICRKTAMLSAPLSGVTSFNSAILCRTRSIAKSATSPAQRAGSMRVVQMALWKALMETSLQVFQCAIARPDGLARNHRALRRVRQTSIWGIDVQPDATTSARGAICSNVRHIGHPHCQRRMRR